ncbi:hypothetical protein P879_06691 [Paragonimus westermani]|uniref:Ku70/Ku80 N-terminal alpha/beta domain-containing protein n=1 Tax=Paragonimus westermani TaxID=34504 RepID=A0A8T0D3A2_9TREM|nr:hypothetical protein P879_06691 [Paragonimus westermani]
MSEIDKALDSFLEDDEEDPSNQTDSSPFRSGLIFLVDCTPSMFGLGADSKADFGARLAIRCCQVTQQNKAIAAPMDMVGLMFIRTRESSTPNLMNIKVIQPLAPPDATRILELENLQQLSPTELETKFGTMINPSGRTFGFCDVLCACQHMFLSCSKTLGYRHIYLFTDDPDPSNGNLHAKRQAISKMAFLKESGIELEVLPIKRDGIEFDFELFYQVSGSKFLILRLGNDHYDYDTGRLLIRGNHSRLLSCLFDIPTVKIIQSQ